MDKQLIEDKVESLRKCIQRIRDKRPDTLEQLQSDIDIQDIITLNLTRAVQLSIDIASHILSQLESSMPQTMAETFDILSMRGIITKEIAENMKKSVGFRNTAVHNYQVINWEIVFNICHKQLSDFKEFISAVDNYV
jgi:uncharacterized protein YutE (UPF0331/DUF86 family)